MEKKVNSDKWVFRVFAACFIASLFIGCAKMGNHNMIPIKYSAGLDVPVNTVLRIDADIVFFRTVDEATRECKARGVVVKAPYINGCHIPGSPRSLIIAVAPVDWNDKASLATLGHEVVHELGGRHE